MKLTILLYAIVFYECYYFTSVFATLTTITRTGDYAGCINDPLIRDPPNLIRVNYTNTADSSCTTLFNNITDSIKIYVNTSTGWNETIVNRTLTYTNIEGNVVVTEIGTVVSGYYPGSTFTLVKKFLNPNASVCNSADGLTELKDPASVLTLKTVSPIPTVCTGPATVHFNPGIKNPPIENCTNIIEPLQEQCFKDSCDNFGCIEGSLKNLCYTIWGTFCCVLGHVEEKCSILDQQQAIINQFIKTGAALESTLCKLYPSSSPEVETCDFGSGGTTTEAVTQTDQTELTTTSTTKVETTTNGGVTSNSTLTMEFNYNTCLPGIIPGSMIESVTKVTKNTTIQYTQKCLEIETGPSDSDFNITTSSQPATKSIVHYDNTTIVTVLGKTQFTSIGKVTSGACIGATVVNSNTFLGLSNLLACNESLTEVVQPSIDGIFVLSGGGCGLTNGCTGTAKLIYRNGTTIKKIL